MRSGFVYSKGLHTALFDLQHDLIFKKNFRRKSLEQFNYKKGIISYFCNNKNTGFYFYGNLPGAETNKLKLFIRLKPFFITIPASLTYTLL